MAELIRVYEGFDWKGLINEAERRGWRRILFLGFSLAHDLLETVLPEEIWEKVRADASVSALAGQVCKNLFCENNRPTGPWENNLFYLKLTERFQDRIGYCLRLALHPTVVDWQAFSLPPSLFFLYHLIHPIRVATKYGWLYLRRLFPETIFA